MQLNAIENAKIDCTSQLFNEMSTDMYAITKWPATKIYLMQWRHWHNHKNNEHGTTSYFVSVVYRCVFNVILL